MGGGVVGADAVDGEDGYEAFLKFNPDLVFTDVVMPKMSGIELVEIIRSLKTKHGKTVLIVEHHLEVVLGLADRVAVLNYGELLICDTPQNVINNPTVQSAYIGTAL